MKKKICQLLVYLCIDKLLRKINKNKLLVITYHGICKDHDSYDLFTHLPLNIFSKQLEYLNREYNIITLDEMLECLNDGKSFPERAAMVTFDDGFMNNYTLAFPELKKRNIPATIFLTVDYVATDKLLWFDELYLLIKKGIELEIPLNVIDPILEEAVTTGDAAEVYSKVTQKYKRLSLNDRNDNLLRLRKTIDSDISNEKKQFELLDWEQVRTMNDSGLITFGIHTATHRILSELSGEDWKKEIVDPKKKLEAILNRKILSFCYPNGVPGIDFHEDHESFLKKAGYQCAFSTGEWLNTIANNNYCLGRIPAGNDITSDKNYFKLNASGAIEILKRFKKY